jgi:hypothetical protein
MLKRNRIDIIQAQSCLNAYREIPIKFYEVNLEIWSRNLKFMLMMHILSNAQDSQIHRYSP